jgi:hypothetical protein
MEKSAGQGRKTHEQFLRTIERKDDIAKPGEGAEIAGGGPGNTRTPRDPAARQSDVLVSRGGMNQESRDHNKHNNPGQSGHKPQKHSPTEEKQ